MKRLSIGVYRAQRRQEIMSDRGGVSANSGTGRASRVSLLFSSPRFNVACNSFPVYSAFSHDVTAAILWSQDNETAAMLVSQTSPVGVEVSSYANEFFCSNTFAY